MKESDVGHVSQTLWASGGKRVVDILVSTAGVVLSAPLLLVAVLAMKLTSPGPAFFRQVRTGCNGREFQPFKLRTMSADHEPDPDEIVPLSHPAVTGVGRVLRRLKIDELPQLLNVLRGEMAVIGPRPTLPQQTREYDDFKRRRLLVRPGITGLAQVNGNAVVSWEERIRYDVYYVKHHDLLMDLGIMLKTTMVLLLGEDKFVRRYEDSPYGRSES